MKKRANSGGSLTWVNVVAIHRGQSSEVPSVPTSTMGGASITETEKGILGVLGAPSISWGEASSSVEASTPAS